MKRYKQANEGIHAPEDVKERAAQPAGKRPYTRWTGAVAAVLAVALIGGIAMWPKQETDPTLAAHDAPLSDGLPTDGESPQLRTAPGGGRGNLRPQRGAFVL